MKKLLKVLHSRWFIAILALFLAVIFAMAAFRSTAQSKEKCVTCYDWRLYNSFRMGLPDYGLRSRNNILAPR